jgi:DnaJ-class molecular chaperone
MTGGYRYALVDCPECKGHGGFSVGGSHTYFSEDETCERCGGSGKVRQRVPATQTKAEG